MKKKKHSEEVWAVMAPYKSGEKIYRLTNKILLITEDEDTAKRYLFDRERIIKVKIEEVGG